MIKTTWTRIPPAAALAALLGAALSGSIAQAEDILLLSANNMRPTLDDIAGTFERATGHRLVITSDGLAAVKDRIAAGERFDVVVTHRPMLDELAAQGRVEPGSILDVARAALVLYVREGAPKPDIGSADALRRTLMAAASVAYADEAVGTPAALYFPAVLERLGIADEMKKKSRLTPIGGGFPLVARGEVTLGIAQTADFAPPIGPPLGVELIGPLPESVQERILLSAAVASSAREPQAARALVIFLASPAASPAIAAHGMER